MSAPDYRPRRMSMCMSIEGFMRNNPYPRGYDVFQRDDGRPLAPQKAREFLHQEKAKGRKVIPCNSECGSPCSHEDKGGTGFDYSGGGCPGHFIEK